MGTASTMTSLAEALGMTLTGCANIPAPDSRRLAIAELSGRRIVDMVWEDLRPSHIMTRQALENAITVDMAIGGSTNAVVHLIAIAGRLGIALDLDDFDTHLPPHAVDRECKAVRRIPDGGLLLCRRPARGDERDPAPAAWRRAHRDRQDAFARIVERAECHRREVIRTAAEPLHREGGTVVLYGNLAPDGAVLKQTAASARLLQHRGRAYVFENYQQMRAEIDREDLPVDEDTVLVMKNCGPKGAPGFPEWGHIPMPRVLLNRGIDDMVRISDARMSGTSFGTVVLHVAPEVGGGRAA